MTPVNIDLEAQLLRTIDRLSSEFQGMFSRETVDRFARESFASLLETAEVTTFLPLFADRFARERLRALAQAERLVPKDRPEVLYVCVHNAGRSQMAALLTAQLSGGRVHVRSAGSDPGDRVNPLVVEAMAELGLDMSAEFPKPLTDEVVRAADAVITMGCGDSCPIYPGKRYEDWELSDPAEAESLEQVRVIREEVRGRVEVLLGELGVPTARMPVSEAGPG
jgi:arsenate reductase (thioredoxin)